MADIFLAYKREDRPRIQPLVRGLEARGYSVWWDSALIAGQPWAKEILKEIESALCVVVVWTRLSVDDRRYASDWVEDEANYGRSRGVLVPALFDQGCVPFVHQMVQFADLVGWKDGMDHPGFVDLIRGVARHAGARVRPEDVELAAWSEAERAATAAAYSAFLADHPASRFADIAKARAMDLEEQAAWSALSAAPTLRALLAFRGQFPAGRFADEAETLLADLRSPPTPVPAARFVPHPLDAGAPPPWASEWGEDRFGVFVGFEVGGVTQLMRWIRPGTFLMGSPDDEPGRFDNEGPRHEVTIASGYWLFDTPCTQALWRAVMGDNPSEFQSDRRPVERVSWNDATAFIDRINRFLPGLDLCLPTEAQWEYACRVGTETAIYTGPLDILGRNNAPALDTIAWYGGNSGREFELKNGSDSRRFPERQYPDRKSGTHAVGLKAPNAWGLYDMLGNIWEWSDDGARAQDGSPAIGPVGRGQSNAARVLRGGSWRGNARSCRSASRYPEDPDDRSDDIGFRCARLHA